MTATIDHMSNDIKIAHFSLTDFAKTHCSKLPFRLVTKANLYRIICVANEYQLVRMMNDVVNYVEIVNQHVLNFATVGDCLPRNKGIQNKQHKHNTLI